MLGFCDIYIFPPFALRREPSVDAISRGRFLAPSSAPKVRFECAGRSSTNTSAPCWLPQHPLVRLEVASGPVQSAGIECAAIVGGERPHQPPLSLCGELYKSVRSEALPAYDFGRFGTGRCKGAPARVGARPPEDVSVLVGAGRSSTASARPPEDVSALVCAGSFQLRSVHGLSPLQWSRCPLLVWKPVSTFGRHCSPHPLGDR